MDKEQPKLIFFVGLLGILILVDFSLWQDLKSYPSEKTVGRQVATETASVMQNLVLPTPELLAHIYYVRFIGNTDPILKQREWKIFAPASLTKILSAVLVYDFLMPSAEISISEQAQSIGEKISGVRPGEIFFRDDLLKFVLISSANDATMALAENIGKNYGPKNIEDPIERFASLMNDKASRLGMRNSHFVNPTGLDADGHYSTAEDLAVLAEYTLKKYPQLWAVTRMIETEVLSQEGKPYVIANTNFLLKEYPAIFGGKTGLTDRAGGALILLYPVKSGKIAVIVILGSENRFNDGRK